MAVTDDFDLYSCAQRGHFPDVYYEVFAFTVDTINVNGDSVGLHPSVFKSQFVPMKEKGWRRRGSRLRT